MGEKIKAEEDIKIEDGMHKGVITAIDFRTDPYNYTDITIEEQETKMPLRCGVPTKLKESTLLGGILSRFGEKIVPDQEYDIQEILEGQKVQFVTLTEKGKNGTFVKIQAESLKPAE